MHWFLTTEARVASCAVWMKWHWNRFSPNLFSFAMLIIIPPSFHTHYYQPRMCVIAQIRQHIITSLVLSMGLWGFISYLALGWLQGKEVFLFDLFVIHAYLNHYYFSYFLGLHSLNRCEISKVQRTYNTCS
jgi:hypothetical protein